MSISDQLKYFKIEGLFGSKDVKLDLQSENNALILVGPNGIGKSTVANIFYYFISRQWPRLLDYKFDKIVLGIGEDKIEATRDDISGLSGFENFSQKSSPRIRNYIQKLINNNAFEQFVHAEQITPDIQKYSRILEMPTSEVRHFHKFMVARFNENDLFSAPSIKIRKKLHENISSRVLYLPTYRRIEKDIRDIFPDFEEKYRRYAGDDNFFDYKRSGNHYVELVSFGMEDVRKNLEDITQILRDYSLSQYNNLSANYLRDVIRGKAGQFVAKEIKHLADENVSSILDRVNEDALPQKDKNLLRQKIKIIQGKNKKELGEDEKYLAHYFVRLKAVTEDLKNKEIDITSFVKVCNSYLQANKKMHYDESTFQVSIIDDSKNNISLKDLSSGEKQVISLFAHLYLDNTPDQILVIDEPELSLSVPWQKKFLPDILHTQRCKFLLAVTHSPFIYENELFESSIDLRKATIAHVN